MRSYRQGKGAEREAPLSCFAVQNYLQKEKEEGECMDTTMLVDTFWVFLAAILVFFMNLGFASVEAGFARSKNTVNILSKNFIVFAVSSLGLP